MKRTVLVFGFIAGLIVTAMMVISTIICRNNTDFEGSMVLGYASMLAAFAFIFVGIRNFRDKYNNGSITFGKAFKIGLYISLIASTMYVAVWLVEYYFFMPDFMDKYSEHLVNAARKSGASAAEMAEKMKEIDFYREAYKNPVYIILMTYAEVFPVGLLVSLIAAIVLRRKEKSQVAL